MRLGTLILSGAGALALTCLSQGAEAAGFFGRAPQACMVRPGAQPASDFARFMAVRGGMQVRSAV